MRSKTKKEKKKKKKKEMHPREIGQKLKKNNVIMCESAEVMRKRRESTETQGNY